MSYLFIFAAAVLWGLIGLFSRTLLDAGLSALEIAFWRALLGGAAFAAHAGLTGGVRLLRPRDGLVFAAFALVGVTLFYASLVLAIQTGGISLAFILLYSAPAFVALLAWWLLGEALTARKAALVGLALAGVALVAGDRGEGVRVSAVSLAWGLTSGLTYASYYIFGKWVLTRYRPVAIYALVLPLGALGLLPFTGFAEKTPRDWGVLLTLSLVSTYLAYLLYYTGLKRAEASRAVLVATVEPVVAGVLAALVYGERFGSLGLLGSACVLTASVLAALPRRGRGAAGV
jgi:drug/metabolite transporter, DME family